MENVQIILNIESTLCLLYVSMLLFIICYLYVLNNFIYFKKYFITYVRICKCKDFKILKLVN